MTENNTPANTIEAITPEDLSAHRAELVRQREQAYAIYLQLPAGEDKEARDRTDAIRALISAWDEMTDYERAEVIRDERTRTEAPAEAPLAHQLAEKLDRISAKPYTDSDDRPTLAQASAHLIELELGNEQKAEAMSNAEATIRQQGDQIRTLSSAQISGDDFRLRDFWERAGELAESAGYCEQYDNLCEQLGGIPRRREYTVSHAITVSVTVMAYTSQTAPADPSSDDFSDWTDYNSDSELADAIREAVRAGDFTIEEEEIQDWEVE